MRADNGPRWGMPVNGVKIGIRRFDYSVDEWSRRRLVRIALGLAVGTFAILLAAMPAGAFTAQSSNYSVDEGVLDSGGGSGQSPSYALTDAGGEAFVGPGSSTTYSFNAGYVAQLDHVITLSIDASGVSLPVLLPGSSQTAQSVLSTRTDAPGYLIAVAEDHDLRHTDAMTLIPSVPSLVAAPSAWTRDVPGRER